MKNRISLTVEVIMLGVSSLSAATLYVSLDSPNPTPPYTNWVTAAPNIQDAVSVAEAGDVVVVTNGTYLGQVMVTKPLRLLSVNGPNYTFIDGGGTSQIGIYRCCWLFAGASLTGFTLHHGHADGFDGGGVLCEGDTFLTNCVIEENSVYCMMYGNNFQGGRGAGVYGGTLYNCTIRRNQASALAMYGAGLGGGAYGSTLYNCTLSGNAALGSWWPGAVGGGAFGCTLYNCIVYSNMAPAGANCDDTSTLNYCCTTPMPASGVGNITNNPVFADDANGNLRLQSNSPCINAGNNAYVTTAIDLDGNPRVVSGTVDVGAYEYQGAGSRISYAWLQQYSFPIDGSADDLDSDRDGLNNWQEWCCRTDPTNAESALRIITATPQGANVTVLWQSVAGVNYFLERSASLATPFPLLATNITGQAGTTSYADTNAISGGPFFYRAGVRSP